MINSSDAYKAAIVGDARQMYVKAILDLISPDVTYGGVLSLNSGKYSKPDQIKDKNFEAGEPYVTLEEGRWKLDKNFVVYPDDPAEAMEQIGYQNDVLSGPDGMFGESQWVEIAFSNVSMLQACGVYFPDNSFDGVGDTFTIEVKQGGTSYFTRTVEGNTSHAVYFDGFTVNNPESIKLTVTKWSIPGRRMRVIEIVPGIYEEWGGDIIAELTATQQVNFACTALPYGTCTLKMDNLGRRFEPRNKMGVFKSIEERQGIPIWIGVRVDDGAIEYKQIGVFYQFSGGWKTGDNGMTMQWDLVDIIGLLANRSFEAPQTLPTTLEGWISALVGQLGGNFADRYKINEAYKTAELTADSGKISGLKCGDILRYVCMAAGCYPFADAASGKLAVEPLWSGGGTVTLDNITKYPVIKANDDVAYIQMKVYGSTETTYKMSGNNSASSNTVSIDNPFIHTQESAMAAARNILACYGGNKIELSGRGDPASECGDVDSIQLDASSATAARRISQDFGFSNSVMSDLPVTLLQADGSLMYNTRVVLQGSGTWTAPSGITSVGMILVGGGDGGEKGTSGTWDDDGTAGEGGIGGKIYAANISINDGQQFSYSCGSGGDANGGTGGDTVFGVYSSENGERFDGYTDIRAGDVYGRNSVKAPLDGSGDGGAGGRAGVKGVKKTEEDQVVVISQPTRGRSGGAGASGCIIIWYENGGTV